MAPISQMSTLKLLP